MENIRIKVNGMTCSHCKASVEKNLGGLEGILTAEADLASATVRLSGGHIDRQQIKEKVEEIGYEYAGMAE